MDIEISTSDPDAIDPQEVASVLGTLWYVHSVSVNEGERTWHDPNRLDCCEQESA